MMLLRSLAAGMAAVLLASAAPQTDPAAATIDAFVRAEMERQHIPGVAVAVVKAGAVLEARGFGLANVEHQVPVTPDGAIDLRKDYTEEQMAQMAYGLKLGFAPGEKWQYSNTGYLLLGIIIRKASGAFYGDVLAERVFKPLGMTTTRVISEADIVPHRAAGYALVKGELKNQGWVSPSLNTTADGALYFSVKDLVAWDAGVRAGRILKAASWASVFEPVRLNDGKTHGYGFGWAIGIRGGQPVYQHGGSWQGFKTHYARFARGNLSVIALANLRQADPTKIVDGIAALIEPALAPSR